MRPFNILRWLSKWLKYFYYMTIRPYMRNLLEKRGTSCDTSRSGKSRSGPAGFRQKLKGQMKIIQNSGSLLSSNSRKQGINL